jgi:hypothetical protein
VRLGCADCLGCVCWVSATGLACGSGVLIASGECATSLRCGSGVVCLGRAACLGCMCWVCVLLASKCGSGLLLASGMLLTSGECTKRSIAWESGDVILIHLRHKSLSQPEIIRISVGDISFSDFRSAYEHVRELETQSQKFCLSFY